MASDVLLTHDAADKKVARAFRPGPILKKPRHSVPGHPSGTTHQQTARQGNGPDDLIDVSDIAVGGLFIKDAVDDVIEKVIAGGGDVEFVDEGMLREWNRIVLIGYY